LRQAIRMVAPAAVSGCAIPLRSILICIGVFLLGSLSDVWLQQNGGTLPVAIIDDALVGIAAGLLVYFYERQQNRRMIRKLEVIRLMNHHVRNSLQVISGAASSSHGAESASDVQDAVQRIDWALREVLPGQRDDINELVFDSPTKESPAQKPKIVA
jgi:signal transduction histidine kinase